MGVLGVASGATAAVAEPGDREWLTVPECWGENVESTTAGALCCCGVGIKGPLDCGGGSKNDASSKSSFPGKKSAANRERVLT